MKDELLSILRCPATGQALEARGDTLATSDARHVYPIVREIPILVDDQRSIFTSQEIAAGAEPATHRPSLVRSLVRRLIPSSTYSVGSEARYGELERLARQLAGEDRVRILVVGGGELGKGMERLVSREDLDVVESDIYLGPRVTVVCDGHQLPFADGSFDAVIAQAVLEHVLDPARVVAEIHRVLRPAGIVYAETPFMQQVHEGAFDFTRFTELGHRRLFRAFDELQRGVVVGPASALTWALRYFARSLPRRSHVAVSVLDKLTTVAFFWLKFLDRVLVTHPGAGDGASGVYFLGRRLEAPIADREIVSTYRGTIGSVAVKRGLGAGPTAG